MSRQFRKIAVGVVLAALCSAADAQSSSAQEYDGCLVSTLESLFFVPTPVRAGVGSWCIAAGSEALFKSDPTMPVPVGRYYVKMLATLGPASQPDQTLWCSKELTVHRVLQMAVASEPKKCEIPIPNKPSKKKTAANKPLQPTTPTSGSSAEQ